MASAPPALRAYVRDAAGRSYRDPSVPLPNKGDAISLTVPLDDRTVGGRDPACIVISAADDAARACWHAKLFVCRSFADVGQPDGAGLDPWTYVHMLDPETKSELVPLPPPTPAQPRPAAPRPFGMPLGALAAGRTPFQTWAVAEVVDVVVYAQFRRLGWALGREDVGRLEAYAASLARERKKRLLEDRVERWLEGTIHECPWDPMPDD